MSQPYVGEIRMVGFSFAPVNWAFCDGAIISIAQNNTLFQLIGTTYGGDGQSTFQLPDLLGRVPIHMSNSYVIGEKSGTEAETVLTQQIPSHNHVLQASTAAATSAIPTNGIPAATTVELYGPPTSAVSTASVSTATGGSQPHNNLQPYVCLNYIISMFGVFPSQ